MGCFTYFFPALSKLRKNVSKGFCFLIQQFNVFNLRQHLFAGTNNNAVVLHYIFQRFGITGFGNAATFFT